MVLTTKYEYKVKTESEIGEEYKGVPSRAKLRIAKRKKGRTTGKSAKAKRDAKKTHKPRRKTPEPKARKPITLRKIEIVSRKGQPRPSYGVQPLEEKSYLKSVSSSWLSTIGYLYGSNVGTFTTKTGRQYKILKFDFETFEEWYYAHSKGTFFNERIKDKYKIVGTL